jgi:hypothetical protein
LSGLLLLPTLALPVAAVAQLHSSGGLAILQGANNAAEAVRVDHPPKLDGSLADPARRKIGPNFNLETGFIVITDSNRVNFRLRYSYRPDSDLFIIYDVGTQFVSLAAANPQQIRETRFAIKFTYSFVP